MSTCIFSTYSQKENRVTSTIIQVLRNLPINLVEVFLANLIGKDMPFITFQNQSKQETSVPDAEISANFKLFIETKIVGESINTKQLKEHMKLVKNKTETLLYITPDVTKPKILEDENSNENLVWKSFEEVSDLIDELLKKEELILSERDQFLMLNLKEFFVESGLIPPKDQVVIVAASNAWDIYKKFGLYICQPGRSFRKVKYIGFYADGHIQPKIAKIQAHKDNLSLTKDEIENDEQLEPWLKERLEPWLEQNDSSEGQIAQVFWLSKKEDDETIVLGAPIENDITKEGTDRKTAYTQGQRYTTLARLKQANPRVN